MCKGCRLPFEQNHTHLSYKQNSSGSLHVVRGKDLDRTFQGIKSHVRRGPCASHKALAHSQNAPFSILTLTLHVMALGGTHVSGKIDVFWWWAKGIIPNHNNLNLKRGKAKKASREIYQIYCSPPNLEFWSNGVPWPTWQQTTITICESQTHFIYFTQVPFDEYHQGCRDAKQSDT